MCFLSTILDGGQGIGAFVACGRQGGDIRHGKRRYPLSRFSNPEGGKKNRRACDIPHGLIPMPTLGINPLT